MTENLEKLEKLAGCMSIGIIVRIYSYVAETIAQYSMGENMENVYNPLIFYSSTGILASIGFIDFSIDSLKEFKKERDYEREYEREELERQKRLQLLKSNKYPTIDDKVK